MTEVKNSLAAHGSSAFLRLIDCTPSANENVLLPLPQFLKDLLNFATGEVDVELGPLLKLDGFALLVTVSPKLKRFTRRKGNTSKANKFVVIEVKDSPAMRLKCNLMIG